MCSAHRHTARGVCTLLCACGRCSAGCAHICSRCVATPDQLAAQPQQGFRFFIDVGCRAFESVTFVTNKGRTLTCGAPRGLPFKEEGHTTAQADDTAPTTSQARSLLAAVTDMGVAAGESDSEGEGQDDDAEVARVRGKGRKQHKTRPGGDSRKKRRGDKDMADRRQGKKGRKPGYNQPPHSHEPDYPQEPDAPYHQHPYMPDYQQPGYGDYPYGPAHRCVQTAATTVKGGGWPSSPAHTTPH